ncbi:dihydrolipoyllysine-residue acetyltransferase [Alteromonas sp. KUL49]|uniref:dihydrolipoyllysine-residue acetyltransferase n=1 Tax=Alteromonas sp. KUL49 TaxID=2480798 RepID=UPI00102EE7A2|nr:dihydrolipoyllysine-residue acetyltransferase [Alteromonas sp. KUL49]TAP40909.1 dihydrolipoyllysine-residue acetyltransferase [Alteromonas sp. KUL49]GEA11090.1 dihydrolipoamide acetyltransferase component of pyruvate dehydrogenase complex [Alteromonas sp. KUL49]
MTVDFILPDIGEGIVECELLEWLINEGDVIEEDQPVAEVMTDKATVQIPAMHSGVVKKLFYKAGEIAKVDEPLFSLDTDTITDRATNASESPVDSNVSNEHGASNSSPQQVDIPSSQTEQLIDFILPDIGEGIVECEIVKWNVEEGDEVLEDQSVVEVMTDKAVVEIPAKHSGVVKKFYYQQGEIAKVHKPLFALSTMQGGSEENAKAQSDQNESSASNGIKPANTSAQNSVGTEGDFEPPIVIDGRVLASPAVRRIAREHNVDLAELTGTGKKGRVLKADVLNALDGIQSQNIESKPEQRVIAANEAAETNTSIASASGKVRVEKLRGVKAAMARQMVASVSTIPHFTVSDDVVMNNLIALRRQLKPMFEAKDTSLSFMPFFIKALSLALHEFPIINSQLNADATEISFFEDHNIGFAVDGKLGLVVPNIKSVQQKSLFDIASEYQDIVSKARAGALSSDQMKGGTISISNIGAIGGINATPVINMPEAAIVALGKTQSLPRFDDNGNVVSQQIMTVNWSGDHRIIDGATMVKFNNLWMQYLTQPETMLIHLR